MNKHIDWVLGRELILSGDLSIPDVAARLGCNPVTVYARRLRIAGEAGARFNINLHNSARDHLTSCRRDHIKGFMRYFSQRPHHFQEVFNEPYSHEAANRVFTGIAEEYGG